MPKVFISHSWEDNAISRQIAEYLKRDGSEIGIDYARIKGGESLPRRISDALEWCDMLVLLWSASAKKSDWVNLEWENALALKKRIIPCILDGINVPGILSRCLYLDFRDPNVGYVELARTFKLSNHKKITPIFRTKPQELSEEDVQVTLKKYDFYCHEWDWSKEFCNPDGRGFKHQYKLQIIQGDKVVLDMASGLMWQQGGSSNQMDIKAAKKWIDDLNQRGYAGFKDWRLPTLEEAMSLMEREKMKGDLYIDPIFDKTQRYIWTADPVVGSAAVWVVDFHPGYCFPNYLHYNYVRAVRSGQSSQG